MAKLSELARVVKQIQLTEGVFRLVLAAPVIGKQAVPGQFVNLKVADGYYPLLRRPFSIANVDQQAGTLEIIYRLVGIGTERLSRLAEGDQVDCLGPLGKGFDLACKRPLLVGGGMGMAPLLFLARTLCPLPIHVLVGGRNQYEIFWPTIFQPVCSQISITTDDGSAGMRGTAADMLPRLLAEGSFDRVYTCGPKPMMERVARIAREFGIPCQVSLEEHMACGFGACLACTCAGTDGMRRKVCSDGPVFWAAEVLE